MRGAAIPDPDADAVDGILEDLRRDGCAVRIFGDRWTGPDGVREAAAHGAYEEAVRLYGKLRPDRRRVMDRAAFLPHLEGHLAGLRMRKGRREAAKEAVDRMVKDGKWDGPL